MTQVLIIGGGFGGVRTALKLANRKGFEVKLLSGRSYFEYHAALYRSATGRSPLEVAIPLHDFFAYAQNVEVIEDEANDLSTSDRTITGTSGTKYSYDSLVLALGNITEYYGIQGLKEYSYGVKNIHQALRLKRHLHEQLLDEQAERNYVVIGAGATGIELAAEMVSYIKAIRRRHKVRRQFKIDLIEAGSRVASSLPEKFSAVVNKRLEGLGVKLYFNTAVKSETVEGIKLPSGEIQSHTVVWTAGVTNNPFFGKFPDIFKLGKNNRVEVDQYLSAAPDVYVIGDSADTPYSGMAQTALHDANFLAINLLRQSRGRSPRAYRPKVPIYAIPVGSRWAAVQWGSVMVTGLPGWVLRRLADLRLYLIFLPLRKALITWRYGFIDEEICKVCKK